MSFLEVSDLHVRLAEFQLAGISLALDRGDYLTIIGPTGAGKTIFIEALVGFWPPDQGRILLGDRDITHELPEHRHIGIVYQDYALMPHMTVFRNIAYGLKKHGGRDLEQSVRQMAASLHIDHLLHRKPATLSGGEQQRVALARALIAEPQLLLMDEPFSALDRQTRREARILLKKAVRERGTTVVHITHDLDDAWAFADKLAVFKGGRMQQFGSMQDVLTRPRSRFIADFVGADLLRGIVVSDAKEGAQIDIGGICLASLDAAVLGAEVDVAIRHEAITLQKAPPVSSNGFNVVPAVLDHVMPEGPAFLVDMHVNGTGLQALVSSDTLQRLQTREGDSLYALIPKQHVKIIDSHQGRQQPVQEKPRVQRK
jgi:molybdate transport system ATP-binding protein